jgi:hypothetical protein
MQSAGPTVGVVFAGALALGALAGPADADGLGGSDSNRPYWAHPPELTLPRIPTKPVTPRPEMRSYQPYSGLQYGFRPEPPGENGIRPEDEDIRPEIVVPHPVPPLIEYGPPPVSTGPSHSYCSDRARCP